MIESKEDVLECEQTIQHFKQEMAKVIVGQEVVVEQMLWCLLAGGHALLEGIPGLGKTLLVRTAAETLDLSFSRIQFTPDLMPSDITGTSIVHFGDEGRGEIRFQPGPVFGHFILADEINRATPKTQSALLEAMQERTVTIGTTTHELPRPFFVLATQNPLESEGTYPLPEAQLDRFLLKINVPYPTKDELIEIAARTTSTAATSVNKIAGGDDLQRIQQVAKAVLVSDEVLESAAELLMMTHPAEDGAPDVVKQYVRFGSGPRGLQAIISTAKVRALSAGRLNVSLQDVRNTAIPALRHRILLNFEGEAADVSTDYIIEQIVARMDEQR